MKRKLEPRMIILEAVKNYVDTNTFNKLIQELYYNYKRTPASL